MKSKEIRENYNKKVLYEGSVYILRCYVEWKDESTEKIENAVTLLDKNKNSIVQVDVNKVEVIKIEI